MINNKENLDKLMHLLRKQAEVCDIEELEKINFLQYIKAGIGNHFVDINGIPVKEMIQIERNIIDTLFECYDYSLESIKYAFNNSLLIKSLSSNSFVRFMDEYLDDEDIDVEIGSYFIEYLGDNNYKLIKEHSFNYFFNALKIYRDKHNNSLTDDYLSKTMTDLYIQVQKNLKMNYKSREANCLERIKTSNPIFYTDCIVEVIIDKNNGEIIFNVDNQKIAQLSNNCLFKYFKANIDYIFIEKIPSKHIEIEYEVNDPSMILTFSHDKLKVRVKTLNEDIINPMSELIVECFVQSLENDYDDVQKEDITVKETIENIDELMPYLRELNLSEKINKSNELKDETIKIVRKKL